MCFTGRIAGCTSRSVAPLHFCDVLVTLALAPDHVPLDDLDSQLSYSSPTFNLNSLKALRSFIVTS